ncbi:transcription elongation factor SPT6 isoform A [Chlorella sorokiniana]|uniref:Transcription elongation factor SPT6 isoform A n=1 Tax=Chlorella sorokiniana TaxID=3076 RepID=A0A2P6TM89_CHLSO|nr:transcription elongation factor SPT6 isoform A [Chlorella sorokiniana]|eukprot:PRW45415.1 transcription elongation factor SPT6 isoform A [Chlorella sorokiniana]
MSDFVDDRAAEEPEEEQGEEEEQAAGGEGSGDDGGLPEDEEEASEGSDDDDSDDSSEEGEDEDEFEKDDFLVEDDEASPRAAAEGEEGGSDVEGAAEAKKRRKKKRRRELVLDEEDYELLEEATGIRRQRPAQQHRRIKKARDTEGGSAAQQDAARALQEELFGQEELEDAGLEDEDEEGVWGKPAAAAGLRGDSRPAGRDEAAGAEPDDQFDQFEEDEDDWLVHEDEEEGAPGAGQRRRRRRAGLEGMPGVDADALEEAEAIFGDVDDLLAIYEDRKQARAAAGGEDEGLDEHEDEEGLDDEEAEARRLAREERARAAAEKRVREQLDPEALARHYLLPKDEQIRETDIPEREQLHRGPDPDALDLAACAHWVWEHLVGPRRNDLGNPTTMAQQVLSDGVREIEGEPPAWYGHSHWRPHDVRGGLTELGSHRALFIGREGQREEQRDWRHNDDAQAELRANIEAVLNHLYSKHEEIPFIAQYRKELCGELLAVRYYDEPGTVDEGEANKDNPRGIIKPHHRRIRRYDVLYAVQSLAQRWRAMQVRREARQRAYDKALGETMHSGEQAAIQACLELLRQADSMEELDDIEAKFRLATQQFADGGAEDQLSQLSLANGGGGGGGAKRRPQRTTPYALCLRAGLGGWVAGLGLSAAQLAENVEAGYKKHQPEDLRVDPLTHAQQFVSEGGGFARPEAVVKAGRHMAATEIAAEPLVRQVVRKHYQDNAAVWTAPTAAGETAIDPFHPLARVKRLGGKPLYSFEGSDDFLRLLQAEKEGLITVRFALPEDELTAEDIEELRKDGASEAQMQQERESCIGRGLVNVLADSYLSSGLADVAQSWDEVRRGVLEEAVRDMLLPLMEREVRTRLGASARVAALDKSGDKLWAYATQAPLQVRLVDDDEVEPDRRVMAVCYGTGNPATTFVMLDPAGNLVDFLHCPQFSGPIPKRKAVLGQVYNMYDDAKKGKDAARIRAFIEDHKPHAIVVGASSPEARTLEQDVRSILESIIIENPRFNIELGTGEVVVLMADESVAAAWENSAAAREELAASAPAPIIRRAVALGRQLLDPLAVLASLCGGGGGVKAGREVLALALHPLQAQLGEEERVAMVERVMTTATSQVGIDLNAVASCAWLSTPLQFVPGLGPRKASALLRAVMRVGGFVESRAQVWRELGVFGNRVFRNAAAYLRIRASTKGAANLDLEPLDDTRIHPESYPYALQMAQSAIGHEGGGEEVAVQNALSRPSEVEALQLDEYDQYLRDPEKAAAIGVPQAEDDDRVGSRMATLVDIQAEFIRPYGDLRRPLEQPKSAEIFWLCCGETGETFKAGRRVEARVRTVGEQDARVVLPDINGIEAVIRRENVSSSAGPDINVRDFLPVNQTVTARVINVNAEMWEVELSTKSSDLQNELHWEHEYLGRGDKYYVVPRPEDLKKARVERRKGEALKVTQRPIQHPLYKNISMADAAALLTTDEVAVGECVIRPSHTGPMKLCLTVKMPEGVWHLDLLEQGKPPGSLKLGSSLLCEIIPGGKKESYEDLDEVAARLVEPLQSNLNALLKHRKYKEVAWDKAKEELISEKRSKPPGYAAYCVGPDISGRPGVFYLGYLLSTTPRREFFQVTPDGFYFRKKTHRDVDSMLRFWQRSPHPPQAQQQQQQEAPPREQQPPLPPPQMQQQQVPPAMAAGQGFYPPLPQEQPPMPGQGPPVYAYGGAPQQQQQPPQFGGAPPQFGGPLGQGGFPPQGPQFAGGPGGYGGPQQQQWGPGGPGPQQGGQWGPPPGGMPGGYMQRPPMGPPGGMPGRPPFPGQPGPGQWR